MDEEIKALLEHADKREKMSDRRSEQLTISTLEQPLSPCKGLPLTHPCAIDAAPTKMSRLIPFELSTLKKSSDEIEISIAGRPLLQVNDIGGVLSPNYALVGVLGKKEPRKQSKNGCNYIVWFIDNLKGQSIKILLFGDAVLSGENVPLGAVCLLLDPVGSRPAPSAAMSLKIHKPHQVIQIGLSAHYATCGFIDPYGFECDKVYNRHKARFCKVHSATPPSSQALSLPNRVAITAPSRAITSSLPTGTTRPCGLRGHNGKPHISRPTMSVDRPSSLIQKPGKIARYQPKKRELLEKIIKRDQPHRSYTWQPTFSRTARTVNVPENRTNQTFDGHVGRTNLGTGDRSARMDVQQSAKENGVSHVQTCTNNLHEVNEYLRSCKNMRFNTSKRVSTDVFFFPPHKVRGIAAILAADELNKDGEVLIPQPSRIFSRGPDSVAYAAFRHEQEAKRQARQVGALQYRQLQQKQSEAKAVRAMNFCKRMGGTIRMIQKPENVMLEPKPRMTAPSSAGNRRQLYADGMGLKEAERLMKSKSKHSAEARGELMEHLHGVFEALGEKETRAEYFKNLSSIEVVAVSCQECNRLFEKHPRLCAKRGHILKRLTIKKRFFICGNQGCSEEVSMLGSAAPHEACSRCGEKLWRAKGKGSKAAAGGEARAKSNGVGVLIPAVSEWNRNADLSSLYTE